MQTIRIYKLKRGMKFAWKMCQVDNKKGKKRNNGKNRNTKSGKNQNTWRKKRFTKTWEY